MRKTWLLGIIAGTVSISTCYGSKYLNDIDNIMKFSECNNNECRAKYRYVEQGSLDQDKHLYDSIQMIYEVDSVDVDESDLEGWYSGRIFPSFHPFSYMLDEYTTEFGTDTPYEISGSMLMFEKVNEINKSYIMRNKDPLVYDNVELNNVLTNNLTEEQHYMNKLLEKGTEVRNDGTVVIETRSMKSVKMKIKKIEYNGIKYYIMKNDGGDYYGIYWKKVK